MAFPEVDQLKELIRPVADEHSLDIETVKTVKAGKKSQVIVALSADDAPTLDQLEEVSNELSGVFDAAEERLEVNFGAGYTLEVTTPGVDLPLTQPRHWRRNRGRRITLSDNSYRVGALNNAEDAVILIEPAPKKAVSPTVRVAPLSEVSGAVVEVEFTAPPEKEAELADMDFAEIETQADTEKDDK